MDHRLEAYVADGCYGCGEARAIAKEISTRFPELQVDIINLDDPKAERPFSVFAVPTFLLNGELLWLGNPQREDAVQQIAAFLQKGREF
ncbi:MAG: thioredoxin family protein [Anaerolineae bacterium]